jgi:predicted negative regulator of RcsB-dependent stress response
MPRIIKKKAKKKNAGVETEVADRLSGIKDQLKEKQKTVLTYGAAAAVAIIAAAGFLSYQYSEGEKARQLEFEAYKVYYNEYQKQPLPGREKYQKALDLFQQAYNKKKSARLLLYIASANAELGKYDDALKGLDQLTKSYSSDRDVLPLAYQKMADIQLKKGNKSEALKALDALYKSNGTIYKDLALMESARILESDGKKEEALAKYKELTEKFKDSPFIAEATAKLAEKKES